MKLSVDEICMVGALGHASGMYEGYSAKNKCDDFSNIPELWVSLVWFSDSFRGYYLKAMDSNNVTIEWRNLDKDKDLPDKTTVITMQVNRWTDAKVLVDVIKRHKNFLKEQ